MNRDAFLILIGWFFVAVNVVCGVGMLYVANWTGLVNLAVAVMLTRSTLDFKRY